MRKALLIGSALAALLGAPALAATAWADSTTVQGQMQVDAESLIGLDVVNAEGETIGEIENVVIDGDGQVRHVIVGVGGFLGIGEKNVGVHFDAIEKSTDANGNTVLVFDATAEELEAAPAFVTIAEMQQQKEMEQPAAPEAEPMAPAAPAPAQ